MADNFQKCLAFVLKEEGGNSDDPHDHGGRTSRGVIQREYDAYRSRKGQAPADVWKATDEEIADIYHTQYWSPYCDGLPSGVDLLFFDYSVNAGRTQAVKDLQRSVGVTADGMYGMLTDQAVKAADPHELVDAYTDRRRAFYRALRQFSRYGKGWMARTDRVQVLARSMISADPSPTYSTEDTDSPKANPQDVSRGPVSAETGAVSTGTTATLAGMIDQAKESLTPYADVLQYIKWGLIALTLLGLALTAYDFVKRQRAKEAT